MGLCFRNDETLSRRVKADLIIQICVGWRFVVEANYYSMWEGLCSNRLAGHLGLGCEKISEESGGLLFS